MNRPVDEVRDFLARWSRTTQTRDIEAHADLYLREPTPLVVFSDGSVMGDWLDVRLRLQRDFERVHIRGVDVHDLVVQMLTPDIYTACYDYDLQVRDMWGTNASVHRTASVTFVRTKDGLRIAAAHYSPRAD